MAGPQARIVILPPADYVRMIEESTWDSERGCLVVPMPWAETIVGPLAVCDYCRLEWPVDHLELVEWTDTEGEEWERRFCSSCLFRLGLT